MISPRSLTLVMTALFFSAIASTALADVSIYNPVNGEILQGATTINVSGNVRREGRNPPLILKLRKGGVTLQEKVSVELMRRGDFATTFDGVSGTGVFSIDAFIEGQLKATVVFQIQ